MVWDACGGAVAVDGQSRWLVRMVSGHGVKVGYGNSQSIPLRVPPQLASTPADIPTSTSAWLPEPSPPVPAVVEEALGIVGRSPTLPT